jgi:CTP-dependent riboflavin kinase
MMGGHLNFSLFMDLTEFLGINERDYVAWYPMIKAFEYMSGYLPYPGSIEIQVRTASRFHQQRDNTAKYRLQNIR